MSSRCLRGCSSGPLPVSAFLWCLFSSACGPDTERQPLSAVLVTLDTTRADALSCYGGGSTPNLDRLAAEGLLYTRAYTTVPITLPAHASMLTGLYPPRHGVRDNGIAALSLEARTLAEAASEAGIETAAFVGAVVLDRAFGLAQGFATYDGPRPGRSDEGHPVERPAGAVIDAALAWLDGRERARPFFLWIHLYDAHHPYAPRSAPPGASERERYLAEVSEADRELGRLFERLRGEGLLERALVCVTADHGEAFGEHQELTHGPFCWNTTLRVPLILRHPDGWRAGTRTEELAGVADLAPTIAEALDIALDEGVDGRSLFRRRVDGERGLYFESCSGFLSFGWSPLAGWLDGRGKYVHSSAPEFFDLEDDPGEEHDLAPALEQGELEAYRAAIDRVVSAPALLPGDERIEPALREQLHALGYAGSDAVTGALPHPLAPSELPSPHAMVGLWRDSMRAQELLDRERFAEAEELHRRILERNPGNTYVRNQLATALMRQKRHREALEELERLRAGALVQPQVLYKIGVCLEHLGRREEALEELQRALDLDPGQQRFRRKLVELLRAAGREEEAARVEGEGG